MARERAWKGAQSNVAQVPGATSRGAQGTRPWSAMSAGTLTGRRLAGETPDTRGQTAGRGQTTAAGRAARGVTTVRDWRSPGAPGIASARRWRSRPLRRPAEPEGDLGKAHRPVVAGRGAPRLLQSGAATGGNVLSGGRVGRSGSAPQRLQRREARSASAATSQPEPEPGAARPAAQPAMDRTPRPPLHAAPRTSSASAPAQRGSA